MTERTSFNPLILLPPIIFLGLAGMFYYGLARDNPNELPSQFVGQQAPVMNLEELGSYGSVPTDADLRKPGVKIVNFWASWCAPCRIEHPQLMKMAADGITIYGINYKDSPENGQKFIEDLGNPFAKIGTDRQGRTGIEWGVYGLPETFVINGEGEILLRYPGAITKRVYKSRVLPAIEEASK